MGEVRLPRVARGVARLQRGWPGLLVEHEHGAHACSPHRHLHRQEEQVGVAVPHAVLGQERLHHLAARRLEGDAQRLVLDVRSQAARVHLHRGRLQQATKYH